MPLFMFNFTPKQQKVFVIAFVVICSLIVVAGCCLGFGLAQLVIGS